MTEKGRGWVLFYFYFLGLPRGSDKMELFRSEEMQLVQLIVPAEAAHDTVSDLGEVGLMQFRDLNPDKSTFQRTYANQVGAGKGGQKKRESHLSLVQPTHSLPPWRREARRPLPWSDRAVPLSLSLSLLSRSSKRRANT